jgi:hypothetical protein
VQTADRTRNTIPTYTQTRQIPRTRKIPAALPIAVFLPIVVTALTVIFLDLQFGQIPLPVSLAQIAC